MTTVLQVYHSLMTWSAVCSHQQCSPLLHLLSVSELYTNLYLPELFCYLMLLYVACPQQHRGIPCYWQLLTVTTKHSEVLKEVVSTQHNLHSASSNNTSSHFAVFIFCLVCSLIIYTVVSLFDITALEVYIEI
jgi:hypothetical protein